MAEVKIAKQNFDKAILTEKKFTTPTIVGWNRLEPRPRSADFERSLKAEIRDALWMLSRQWQMGEFKGEDAGSPIDARLLTTENTINRYAVKDGEAVPYDDSIPLETKVERESIPDNIQLKIQVSTQFLKIISRLSLTKDYTSILKTNYSVIFSGVTEEENMILCNQESYQVFEQAKLRSIDGYNLLQNIQTGNYDIWINSHTDIEIPAVDKATLIDAGQTLLNWFKRLYNQPDLTEDQAWNTPYLEYQFECSAPTSTEKQIILTGDQYKSGHLDWYSFNIDKSEDKLTDKVNISDVQEKETLISFIPTTISFGGMPNPRYWEMEDQKTDFGAIDANTTDIAKMIIAEFGLICSNDWFILPYSMPTGNLCEINGMIVTDTFGDRTLIRAAGSGEDDKWETWRLFNMSVNGTGGDADMRLLLYPSIVKVLQSEPLEKVNLIRDEMANMVWGVENTITLPSGTAKNGFEAATEFTKFLTEDNTDLTTNLDASVKYSLGSTIPENWIPFISVHVDGSNRDIQMQRASMSRTNEGSITLIEPRTTILEGDTPFYIHEDEVPRSGTIVSKNFQRTRWYNGKVILWLGRKVTNGKGEGNSGLMFDQVKKI
jgi:hypothetical protein